MKDQLATGSYYTLAHIAQFTGLTERTLRSYISNGLLKGEKINGLWHFTPEQTDAFMRHPAVRPSIRAKKNALVYDFLLDRKKAEAEICVILDLPEGTAGAAADYFCDAICQGEFWDLRFSLDSLEGNPRIILKGHPAQVLELVDGYLKQE